MTSKNVFLLEGIHDTTVNVGCFMMGCANVNIVDKVPFPSLGRSDAKEILNKLMLYVHHLVRERYDS